MSIYTTTKWLARAAGGATTLAGASLIALAVVGGAAPIAGLMGALALPAGGAIVALGNAPADRAKPRPAETALTFEAPVTDAEIEDLRRLLLGNASAPSITAVAKALGISTGEASKRVARAEKAGLVAKARDGKRVTVTLVA